MEAEEVLNEFLKEAVRDLQDGGLKSIREYKRQFPGEEALIEGEYRRMVAAEEQDGEPSLQTVPRGAPSVQPSAAVEGGEATQELLDKLRETTQLAERYRIEGEVGRGGMGAILGVWDDTLRRKLAMKVALGEQRTSSGGRKVSATSLARFLEEAQVTGQLDHPGVVPVHELGLNTKGAPYFTMRLIKGQDFSEIVNLVHTEAGGWSLSRALGVLLRASETMSYAHSKGVIHRDLKPANLRVGKYGEVYVMDWGLAKVIGQPDVHDLRFAPPPMATSAVETNRGDDTNVGDSPIVTMDGTVVGTPAYMSLEQAEGRLDELGPHSDVYSMGAMLYELLTGQCPYVSPIARLSPRTVLASLLLGPPTPIHEIAPDVPPELEAICSKAMERDWRRRYADMAAMAEDLRAYIEQRVVRAYRTGPLTELRMWARRNRSLAATVVVATIVFVVGLSGLLYLRGEAKSNAAWAIAREKEAEELARIAVIQDAHRYTEDAEELWPPHPERIDAYRAWLKRASELASQIPPLTEKMNAMLAAARSRTSEEIEEDRAAHPRHAELVQVQGELATREAALARRRGGQPVELPIVSWGLFPQESQGLNAAAWDYVEPERREFGKEALGLALALRALQLAPKNERSQVHQTIAWAHFALGMDDEALDAGYRALEEADDRSEEGLGRALERLEEEVEAARSAAGVEKANRVIAELEVRRAELLAATGNAAQPRFAEANRQDGWWYSQLRPVLESVRALESGLMKTGWAAAPVGWSIPKRLAFAERLKEDSREGGRLDVLWKNALPRIHKAYPGLTLKPQVGLVPLGPDPATELWEFGHLATGDPPRRSVDGKLLFNEESSLVFVLLPGGTYVMGAQGTDPNGPNYDPHAYGEEGPPHDVHVGPFFLSKYEMSWAQWKRAMGEELSQETGYEGAQLPAEGIGWFDCAEFSRRFGLELPTEAQWEFAARAGTSSIWHVGDDREGLLGAANIGDLALLRATNNPTNSEEWFDDGFGLAAPVDALAPNAFGLHGVVGNVWEWCRDTGDVAFYARSPMMNPVASGEGKKVLRGGAYNKKSIEARSSRRPFAPPDNRTKTVGFRPARRVHAGGD